MGVLFSSLKDWFNGEHLCQILMYGLGNAGKTTILYRLAQGIAVSTFPTIGCHVEKVSYRNISFCVWDYGSRNSPDMRHCLSNMRHHFPNVQAIIFVVDSTDHERFVEARDELQTILKNEELREVRLLVFCNKSDRPTSKDPEIVANELGLNTLTNREWAIQSCSAVTRDGLLEGLKKLYLSIMEEKMMNGEIN